MAQQLKVFENFEALGLREDLLRGIYAYGFERPRRHPAARDRAHRGR